MSRRRRARRSRRACPLRCWSLAIVAIAFFALPLIGLLWRAPWGDAWSVPDRRTMRTALRLSIVCSLWATGLSIVFGVPLAWLLARVEFPGAARCGRCARCRWCCRRWSAAWRCSSRSAGVASSASTSTLVRHPAAVHDRRRGRGPDVRGDAVPGDHRRGALRQIDPRFEDASRTLGGVALVHVPTGHAARRSGPALVAGAVLAWARALGEFGATITFAGNFPGTTQTMPLAVYLVVGDEPGGGDRARPVADRDVVRRARRPARSLARRVDPSAGAFVA